MIVVTKATGGTSKPLAGVYVPAEQTAAATPALDGVDAEFVADLLSACVAHERCGTHLYRSAAARTADAELLAQYEHFGEETAEHVQLLEQLITTAGGDPAYVSPAARATERTGGALLESTFLLDGSIDPATAELTLLEAVMLAETKDRGNWELLRQLSTALPQGELRTAFDDVTARVLEQEEEHYRWAHDTLAARCLALATGGAAAATTPADVESMNRSELYALAQELDVPGRSTMTRDELATAVAESDGGAS